MTVSVVAFFRRVTGVLLAAVLAMASISASGQGFSFSDRNSRTSVGAERGIAQQSGPQILFIGNSFTFYNDLPGMLVAFFAAGRQTLQVESHTPGATMLREHADNPDVARKIASRKWSFVVLQDQSQIPAIQPEETLNSGRTLCEMVRKAGATPVFYLTWGYKTDDAPGMDVEMQNALNKAYAAAARETKALLAPVGPAWLAALQKDPKVALYVADGHHPSPEGSYLAACVIYATVTKRSPLGLPSRVVSRANGRQILHADLSPARARFLQQVAWDTVQNFSPDKLQGELTRRDNALPSLDDVRAKLRKAMPLAEIVRALGQQPSQRNDKDRVYIFKIRGEQDLWIVYGTDGVIKDCHAMGRNGGAWIKVDLP